MNRLSEVLPSRDKEIASVTPLETTLWRLLHRYIVNICSFDIPQTAHLDTFNGFQHASI